VITKEYITELKNRGNGDLVYLLENQKDNKSIVFILENLGHLPDNFNGKINFQHLNITKIKTFII